jgi:hypothetical protein
MPCGRDPPTSLVWLVSGTHLAGPSGAHLSVRDGWWAGSTWQVRGGTHLSGRGQVGWGLVGPICKWGRGRWDPYVSGVGVGGTHVSWVRVGRVGPTCHGVGWVGGTLVSLGGVGRWDPCVIGWGGWDPRVMGCGGLDPRVMRWGRWLRPTCHISQSQWLYPFVNGSHLSEHCHVSISDI